MFTTFSKRTSCVGDNPPIPGEESGEADLVPLQSFGRSSNSIPVEEANRYEVARRQSRQAARSMAHFTKRHSCYLRLENGQLSIRSLSLDVVLCYEVRNEHACVSGVLRVHLCQLHRCARPCAWVLHARLCVSCSMHICVMPMQLVVALWRHQDCKPQCLKT